MNYVVLFIFPVVFIIKFNVYHIYNLVAYHKIYNMSCLNDGIYIEFHTIH
jgi:hypothetical protein